MFTKIYWLHQLDSAARLGIMAKPHGDDWLGDEIAYFSSPQGLRYSDPADRTNQITNGINDYSEAAGLKYRKPCGEE